MGNIVNTFKRFSGNNTDAISLSRCSYLSNGTPRLDKCAFSDNDSSVTRKTASAMKSRVTGCEDFSEEVPLTMGSTSISGQTGDIDCFVLPLANTDLSGGGVVKKKRETMNEVIQINARGQGDGSDSTDLICNRTADHISCSLKDERIENSKHLKNGLAMDTHESKQLILFKACHANSLFHYDGYQKWTDCGTPESSVNDKVVPNEDFTVCAPVDVKDCGSTPKVSSKRKMEDKTEKYRLYYIKSDDGIAK